MSTGLHSDHPALQNKGLEELGRIIPVVLHVDGVEIYQNSDCAHVPQVCTFHHASVHAREAGVKRERERKKERVVCNRKSVGVAPSV
eukprot:6125444-Alexandrium_andersonii.AAC.1